ncbi:type I-E CRISPR-associated protein Cse2/CasB [Streptomyces sp. NPDC002073]
MTTSITRPETSEPGKPKARDRREQFVVAVLELCARSKGARADLRSGLGQPYERCHRLHRHLVRLVPERERYPQARRPYYAVAALIADRSPAARMDESQRTEPAAGEAAVQAVASGRPWWERPNLGASLAEAVNAGLMKPDSAESELHYMARIGSDALHSRLPALLRQLLGRGVLLDWVVLLDDLSWWDQDQNLIATRWLESYFRVRTAEERRLEAALRANARSGEDGPGRGHDENDNTTKENE